MTTKRKFLYSFFLLFMSLAGVRSFSQDSIYKDSEYKEMLEDLNRRYEDFFIHEQDQKRWESQRKSGILELKNERQAYENAREKARFHFVRTPPPDMEPARLRWEAEQSKAEKEHEVQRRSYVLKRDEIKKVQNSARKIPEDKEVGLE